MLFINISLKKKKHCIIHKNQFYSSKIPTCLFVLLSLYPHVTCANHDHIVSIIDFTMTNLWSYYVFWRL